jgi:hypothetical protein
MAATQLDYEALSKLLLTTQYRRPLLEALVGALAGAFQDPDDIALRLPEETLGLDSAVGVQLENLADLVGAPVIGTEEQTRAPARTWIRRNRSQGTLEDVIAVVRLFPVSDFDVAEVFPASIEVTAFEVSADLGAILALVISGTRAAGVGAGVLASANDRDNTFQFSRTGPDESGTTYGFDAGIFGAGFVV